MGGLDQGQHDVSQVMRRAAEMGYDPGRVARALHHHPRPPIDSEPVFEVERGARSSRCDRAAVVRTPLRRVATETDGELMLRVQLDDCDAFRVLYGRFSGRAHRMAYSVVRDSQRSDDIVQEAFMSAWRSRASYRPERGTVVAWLMGTVKNSAIDSLRQHGRHASRRASVTDIDEKAWVHGSVEETISERDQAARLRSTVAKLPVAQRDVITLAYFGELSSSEIAAKLSLPLGTVKGRIRLGLNRLRAAAEG